jgi:carbonic anhydrase/acetyltransferase-like protein (isoleucine patch superfamily)
MDSKNYNVMNYLFKLLQNPLGALWGKIWPFARLIYRRQFMEFGDSIIFPPSRITGAQHISIGDKTIIDHYCELSATPLDNLVREKPIIKIGNRCVINGYNRIGATSCLEIHNDVLMASNIFLSDSDHQYRDVNIPIRDQPWIFKGPVIIESGCWLGDGVKVFGGVRIGKNSVIGANSVVLKDIPPLSVAIGVPARVVKRWDVEKGAWIRV